MLETSRSDCVLNVKTLNTYELMSNAAMNDAIESCHQAFLN